MKTYDELSTIGKLSVWFVILVSALLVLTSLVLMVVHNIVISV
jgi:hypothetical protein